MNLSRKSIACLELAEITPKTDPRFENTYELTCELYSEKAVNRKMQELVDRGYIASGYTARTGHLTGKGRAALAAVRGC